MQPVIQTQPRYEIKIPLPPSLLPRLRLWLRLHESGWRKTYPPRWVNSLYFDNDEDEALIANIDGIPYRQKLRLRWYDDYLHRIDEPHLELKIRRGRIGWKRSHIPLRLRFNLCIWTWDDLITRLHTCTPFLPILLRYPRPKLIVRYHRSYYLSGDGLVRLTIDGPIQAYPQHGNMPNYTHVLPGDGHITIEFKTPIEHREALATILGRFPFRPQRHSKYAMGRIGLIQSTV